MGGEGAPSCADKKKKALQSGMGWGVWKPGKRSPPALPAGALGGPRLWRLSPLPRMCSVHAPRVRGSPPGPVQPRPDLLE